MTKTRSCGGCTACCTVLAIETPELRKAPGVSCTHCTAEGCAIYETRFAICRSYQCGWFGLPELDESWRPDRSGLLLGPHDDGIEFLVIGGEAAVRRPAFLAFLRSLTASATPAFLCVPGPAGHYPARVRLNEVLARVPARDWAALLAHILESAKGHRFAPMPPSP